MEFLVIKIYVVADHQNYFGEDEHLGPLAISIRRERVADGDKNANGYYQYRVIIRTGELLTIRGTVLEESIPHLRVSSNGNFPWYILD